MALNSFKKKMLEKSGSYNFYKTEYNKRKYEKPFSDKLDDSLCDIQRDYTFIKNQITAISDSNKQFNDIFSLINDLYNQNRELKEQLMDISNCLKQQMELVNNLKLTYDNERLNHDNEKLLNEIKYANVFKDTINNSEWLINKSFSLNNSAANYSFIYVLYRILNEIKPSNILELGLGQSTIMTTQYVSFFKDAKLQVIEDNQEWIDYFSNKLNICSNVKINQVDTEKVLIDSFECLKYEDFNNLVKNESFDLVIIDGPLGFGQKYPRSNILDLVDNIAESFVIIIDDYEREGEINTSKKLLNKLSEKGIKFHTFICTGLKNQLVIYSEDNMFVGWY